MAKAIVTPEKIEKFLVIVPRLMMGLTIEADQAGSYFWADVTQGYRQVFDVDSGKQLGGGVHADAPALDGVIDADAGVDAGLSITKSREGGLEAMQTMRFRSRVALETEATDSPDP